MIDYEKFPIDVTCENKANILNYYNIDIHKGKWESASDNIYTDPTMMKHICENMIDIHDYPCSDNSDNSDIRYCSSLSHRNNKCISCGHNKNKCIKRRYTCYNIMEKVVASITDFTQGLDKFYIINMVLDNGFYPTNDSIRGIKKFGYVDEYANYIQSYLPLIDGIKKYDINNILINPKNITINKHIPKILLLIAKYGKPIIPSCLFKHMILPYVFTKN